MTAGATATPLNQDQAGGQDGIWAEVLEPGQQMAADERGVFGDFGSGAGG